MITAVLETFLDELVSGDKLLLDPVWSIFFLQRDAEKFDKNGIV